MNINNWLCNIIQAASLRPADRDLGIMGSPSPTWWYGMLGGVFTQFFFAPWLLASKGGFSKCWVLINYELWNSFSINIKVWRSFLPPRVYLSTMCLMRLWILLSWKSKCHRDKPGQFHQGLRVPNLSFDMLHELPHRNYNIPHLTASTNMCKIQVGIKYAMLGNRNISWI